MAKKKEKIPRKILEEANTVGDELSEMTTNPSVLENAENFQKKVTNITIQSLFRQFNSLT
jgi:hypothetical protein